MTVSKGSRLWYCPEARVDTYRSILNDGGNPTVIQIAKVLRTILLNAMVVGLAWFSVRHGGDPTWVPTAAFFTLSVVNGFEYSDWAAFRQAYQEASANDGQQGGGR